jgi:hypothetical protein
MLAILHGILVVMSAWLVRRSIRKTKRQPTYEDWLKNLQLRLNHLAGLQADHPRFSNEAAKRASDLAGTAVAFMVALGDEKLHPRDVDDAVDDAPADRPAFLRKMMD